MRLAGIWLMLATLAFGADYKGPRPPQADVPFLLHASTLLKTEVAEAKEESKKDDTTYIISGAASEVKTPLAEPIFLLESDTLNPDRLELYRLEVRNGRREVTMNQKKRRGPKPLKLLVNRLSDRLYRIEVAEMLDPGEYSLSPADSNRVFCFQVY